MEATTSPELWLDFEDIAEQLKGAGDDIAQQLRGTDAPKGPAAIVENGYAPTHGALFYRITIQHNIPEAWLVVQGLQLGYRRFAVHGILYLDGTRTLCTVWTFTDVREAGEPDDLARCTKCLVDCSRSVCQQGGVKTIAIPHDSLRASVATWIRQELQLPEDSEAPA